MKSASIEALAYLLKTFYDQMDISLIKNCTELILLVTKDKKREIYRSILKYIKNLYKHKSLEILEEMLPTVLEALLQWDNESARAERSHIRNFFSVLLSTYP